jgi:prepilin-type N-terminal cleavage/methylation domain-containing protein
MPSRQAAFSLIELLVVVGLIAILASMVIVGAGALGIGSKRAKTTTILATVRKAIELTIANRGGGISPVDHPLAGSRRPVPVLNSADNQFVRGKHNLASDPSAGVNVDQISEALAGLQYAQADNSGKSQVMLPTDVFANKGLPLLYGLRRERIGVIGAQQKAVSKYRLLPKPYPPTTDGLPAQANGSNVTVLGKPPSQCPNGLPYNDTNYPNTLIPSDNQDSDLYFGLEGANKVAIDYVLGSSGAGSELTALKALYQAPEYPADLTDKRNIFKYPLKAVPVGGANLARVYTDAADDSKGAQGWRPGYVMDGTQSGSPCWKHYKLAGLALYDAWGVEILYSISTSGSPRLLSAGADGVFRYNPGPNHQLQTNISGAADPENASLGGDDQDGNGDNVKQEVVE